ncbi:MAG: hypothetical protein EZS28_046487, partial [Streblomastix strix]
ASAINAISALAYAASNERAFEESFVFMDINLGFSYRNSILYVITNVING